MSGDICYFLRCKNCKYSSVKPTREDIINDYLLHLEERGDHSKMIIIWTLKNKARELTSEEINDWIRLKEERDILQRRFRKDLFKSDFKQE